MMLVVLRLLMVLLAAVLVKASTHLVVLTLVVLTLTISSKPSLVKALVAPVSVAAQALSLSVAVTCVWSLT